MNIKPLKHIDRVWLRRAILVVISLATIWLYLCSGIAGWWRDLCQIWHQQ